MISNKSQKTAQTPSFGMSAYGQTSVEVRPVAVMADVQVWTCAQIRHIGDTGLTTTTGAFPGTNAWRPPSC